MGSQEAASRPIGPLPDGAGISGGEHESERPTICHGIIRPAGPSQEHAYRDGDTHRLTNKVGEMG